MARDLDQLAKDWRDHPSLRYIACKDVHQLAEHLEKIHYSLMNEDHHLASGYLYQKQVEVNKKLRKELEECRKQIQNKSEAPTTNPITNTGTSCLTPPTDAT